MGTHRKKHLLLYTGYGRNASVPATFFKKKPGSDDRKRKRNGKRDMLSSVPKKRVVAFCLSSCSRPSSGFDGKTLFLLNSACFYD